MRRECEKKVARRVQSKNLPLGKRRKGFAPVESGFRKEEAIQEARRCLGANACEACEVCSLFCPDLCITRDEKSGSVLITLIIAKGAASAHPCAPEGPFRWSWKRQAEGLRT